MASPPGQPLGFSLFSAAPRKKSGELQILRDGRPVTLLGAAQAERLLAALARCPDDAAGQAQRQRLLARATGNYKRGNEKRRGVSGWGHWRGALAAESAATTTTFASMATSAPEARALPRAYSGLPVPDDASRPHIPRLGSKCRAQCRLRPERKSSQRTGADRLRWAMRLAWYTGFIGCASELPLVAHIAFSWRCDMHACSNVWPKSLTIYRKQS